MPNDTGDKGTIPAKGRISGFAVNQVRELRVLIGNAQNTETPMTIARWRSILDDHPDVREVLSQLVQDLPASERACARPEHLTAPNTEWTPFTPQERVLARQVGWDD